MAGDTFCLRLKLHTPLILPRAAPRLDVLLAEAVRNLRLDWDTPIQASDIPLAWDAELRGLRGSQLVFGTTPQSGLVAESVPFPTAIRRLPFSEVSPPIRKRITVDGGPTAPRLSEHPALLAPYALFYGVGDAMRCAELLTLLSGIGREHAHGCGLFSVESIESLPDDDGRWRWRPWATDKGHAHAEQPYPPVVDHLALVPGGDDQPVLRPPRVLKEALHHG
ncbi:hypothetical protein [Halomonas alkalicola]|uniref:Uncharacterized protein n=1 Tax=Halomonas alkalicola TaxID=1930622 RepID=A0ABY9H691_9GAMM|nr:hypothetical protein [Halomonas alkalicola]WLI74012.1 hypothetical protein B6N23_03535 [Halomonas alkalicola]